MILSKPAKIVIIGLVVIAVSIIANRFFFRKQYPNIVLITLDTVRADHLSSYGHPTIKTPSLDRLQKQGILIRENVCQVPITLPSFCSIMTGKLPHELGVHNNGTYTLPQAETTLAEELQRSGYHTAAFIGAYPLHSNFGLDQGFDFYDDDFLDVMVSGAGWQSHFNERRGMDVTNATIKWVTAHPESPFFLWIHYYDAHTPYAPPPPWNKCVDIECYDQEINYLDRCIERLLRAFAQQDLLRDAIICVLADHGESLGAHGEATHGTFLYDTTVLAPLLIVYPGALARKHIFDMQVENVDVMPTVLELASLPTQEPLQGTSLVPSFHNLKPIQDKTARIQSLQAYLDFGWHPLTAIRSQTTKVITGAEEEIYDLTDDPEELHPGEQSESSKSLSLASAQLFNDVVSSLKQAIAQREISQEEIDRLKTLGYVAGKRPVNDAEFAHLPDPKAMLTRITQLFDDASLLASQKKYTEAIDIYDQILTSDPANPTAFERLGHTLFLDGQKEKAVEAYQTALKLAPSNTRLWTNLGNMYVNMSQYAPAESSFLEAFKLNPSEPSVLLGLGDCAMHLHSIPEAITRYEQAIKLNPDLLLAHAKLIQAYNSLDPPQKDKVEYHQKEMQRIQEKMM